LHSYFDIISLKLRRKLAMFLSHVIYCHHLLEIDALRECVRS